MKRIIIISSLLVFVSGLLSGCDSSDRGKTYYFDKDGNMTSEKPSAKQLEAADKLEVYYFHRSARCFSCNTMGEFVRNLLNNRYGEELKSGKIVFEQLNVELPENKEIAKKFQASGSSLFINRIIDGEDNIEQDTAIWRVLGSEESFNKYLGDKINSYLDL